MRKNFGQFPKLLSLVKRAGMKLCFIQQGPF